MGLQAPTSPGAGELAETKLTLFFTHLFVDKMGARELGILEGETNFRSIVCLKSTPIFPLATAWKMLSNSLRTISQAQPVTLTVSSVAPRSAIFPVQAMAQVYTQQERSNITSLAVLKC